MSVSSSSPYPSPPGVVPRPLGRGIFACPKAPGLWRCLMRLWACSPLIQASAAPAVASSVAIFPPAVLSLLSPRTSAAPPAAATWWWERASAAGAVTGARRPQPLPASPAPPCQDLGTGPGNRNGPPAAAPPLASRGLPGPGHQRHALTLSVLRSRSCCVPSPRRPEPRAEPPGGWASTLVSFCSLSE